MKNMWTHIAYDESNSGRYPEICVCVTSIFPQDYKLLCYDLKKRRESHKGLKEKLQLRDFRFCFFTETDKYLLENQKHKKLGLILASLLHGIKIEDKLTIYIDGEWNNKIKDYASDLISDITKIEKTQINLEVKGNLDRRMNLVNIADETAHWIYKKNIEELTRHKKRKKFLVELIQK